MNDETNKRPDVAAEVTRPAGNPRGHLPRLPAEFYRGHAFVLWTHTMRDRASGWLDTARHAVFREALLHAAVREQLLCPIYVMMPDHIHLIWIGVAESGDQRTASSFLRTAFGAHIEPSCWQHQPHDSVLREVDRARGAFASTCAYIAENPVRRGLVEQAEQWPFNGCMVPGYPKMTPFDDGYWDLFWRIHFACVERGRIGKM